MLGLTDKILDSKPLMYSAVALAFIVAGLLVLLLFRLAFGRRSRLASAGRARQQRLGLVDAFNLDRQRQLIIVRRDNIEHLLMVGGPNDVLIESQIVRAEPARELLRARDKEPDLRPALPVGFGAEPAAVAIVPPAAVSIVPPPAVPVAPAAATPFAAPSSVPPPALGDAPPLAAEADAPSNVAPVTIDARQRAPQSGLRPVPASAPSRAPLFPLPPRRPLPPLAKPPVTNDVRVEPDLVGGEPTPPGGLGMPAPGPLPRPGQVPLRAPGFLRPPPLRPVSRQVEPTSDAPPVRDDAPHEGRDGAPAVATAAPPPLVGPAGPVAPAAETFDPFDSIEEEMAKLLGRGGDKS